MLIRHVKEIIRSQLAALPWRQPKPFDEDLVKYSVSRKNLRRSPSSSVCPIVAFLGMKPSYKKTFELAYGDYVEMYNPAVISNNVEHQRTEAGIALWPTWNNNGSWTFFSLHSKMRVRRSNWVLMPTTQMVIDAMNTYA
ncbi:MAG: hypothetical protein ACK56F_01595, partial [bacterium]